MTEKEVNAIKNRYLIQQLYKPTKKLCVILNDTNEKGERVHIGYDVDCLAVCFDGMIRPVVLVNGGYRVFDEVEDDYSGFYTDRDLQYMRKNCKHEFKFFG